MKNSHMRQKPLCVEDIVQNKPLLTEEEMKQFSTYEEIVEEAITMFDNKVKELLQKNVSSNS